MTKWTPKGRLTLKKMLATQGMHCLGKSTKLRVRGEFALFEWVYRHPVTKKTCTMILGSAKGPGAIGITEAHARRGAEWMELRKGTAPTGVVTTPIAGASRRRGSHAAAPAVTVGRSFGEVLEMHLAVHAPKWKGGVDGDEAVAYRRLLGTPLAALDVAAITQHEIVNALAPWKETPSQEKFRIKVQSVLDHATSKGLRAGENPARAAIMKNLLPAVPEAKPHGSLPAAEVPALMAELAEIKTNVARALRWTILTGARVSQTRGMTWGELNGDWSIPAERMKQGKPHTVPITPEMRACLPEARAADDDLVFPGVRAGAQMAQQNMNNLFQDRRPDSGCDVHGFRATFGTWAEERGYDQGVIEAALAHSKKSKIVATYQRGDRLEARRKLMADWNAFAAGGKE